MNFIALLFPLRGFAAVEALINSPLPDLPSASEYSVEMLIACTPPWQDRPIVYLTQRHHFGVPSQVWHLKEDGWKATTLVFQGTKDTPVWHSQPCCAPWIEPLWFIASHDGTKGLQRNWRFGCISLATHSIFTAWSRGFQACIHYCSVFSVFCNLQKCGLELPEFPSYPIQRRDPLLKRQRKEPRLLKCICSVEFREEQAEVSVQIAYLTGLLR